MIFKIVEDDNTQAVQLQSGEIDMALLDPKMQRISKIWMDTAVTI